MDVEVHEGKLGNFTQLPSCLDEALKQLDYFGIPPALAQRCNGGYANARILVLILGRAHQGGVGHGVLHQT